MAIINREYFQSHKNRIVKKTNSYVQVRLLRKVSLAKICYIAMQICFL